MEVDPGGVAEAGEVPTPAPSYALLIRPAANRVFGGDAARLSVAELTTVAGPTVTGATTSRIAGVEYLRFDGTPDLAGIAALSSTYALFEVLGDAALRPVELPVVDRYDDDLVSTQRYVGKTNETFTKLLLNVTLASVGAWPPSQVERRLRVLDPLCGRGTTLNQALRYGADALGVDVDQRSTEAYATFLRTWLQEKRVKHQIDGTVGRRRFRATIGRKGASGADARQIVDVVTGDTAEAPTAFGRGNVDVIVTDLPYGVQHGARAGAGLQRRPEELLERALPAWRSTLRPSGAAGIAWNTKVLSRPRLRELLSGAGYELTTVGEGEEFVHRVDRTITRDLVVARRPAAG